MQAATCRFLELEEKDRVRVGIHLVVLYKLAIHCASCC